MDYQLRPWKSIDLTNLVRFANNPNIASMLTNGFPHPYTEAAGKTFIEKANSNKPEQILAIVVGEEACGGIGIHPQSDIWSKNAELGYWLAEPYWGKGIMSRAVNEMVEYTFMNFNFERLFARPFGSNIASQKVLKKAGFLLEARLSKTIFKSGKYHDELIYSIRKP